MSEQIIISLKRKLDNMSTHSNIDAETKRNALKEELQFYILNFIYQHSEYSKWIMYGGSALRICHNLNRMSVDLDFEISHTVTKKFLNKVKKEVEGHFFNTYGARSDFITVKITTGRGLLFKFHIGEELSFGHTSKQVHVKIDLNYFVAPKTVIQRIPVNHGQFSFVILIYNMSALMASKIAAIFLRGTRGVGKAMYAEKGRDIYDLLWYMNKKVVPDFDYLIAKGIDIKDPGRLFNQLTLQMNKVSDKNLKQDLTPLFVNRVYIEDWLQNWRESYMRLLEEYKINIVTRLEGVQIRQDFHTDNFYFKYRYRAEDGGLVKIVYVISDRWFDGDLSVKVDKKLDNKIELVGNDLEPSDKLKKYTTLFYKKTEKYLKKTNRTVLGDSITTKLIRMTADNLDQKDQIVLNKSALLSCELDDLLK